MKLRSVLQQGRGMRIPFRALVACVTLAGVLGAAEVAHAQNAAAATGFHKVLFLGNSITRNGPSPKVDWAGNWGMAASAPDKDYVHLVTHSLSSATGTPPEVMVQNIAEFERHYADYDVDGKMKEAFGFGADLVIVAIGENVPQLVTDEAKVKFKQGVMKVLNGLRAGRPFTLVVRSRFWANAAIDQILRQACQDAGGIYVDIGALGKDEANYARSERTFKHSGVAAHPGDKGMQAIADAILNAIRGQQERQAVK